MAERKPTQFWRADSGFRHNRETTVADVIRHETEFLGNNIWFRPEILPELERIPARRCAWVTKRKEDARRYGIPRPFIAFNYKIVAEDGQGGYLIVI